MKKILITIILSILLMSSVSAVDQYMLGNTSGRNLYRFYDLTSVTATNLYGILNASYISNAPWISTYSETDPIYSAWDKDYNDITNKPNLSLYYLASNPNGYISSYTETDPIYSAWSKDYNDLTNKPNLSIYNDSSAIALKLDIIDQRYNETGLINAVNSSLSNKLNVTDQRYNDTAAIALKLDITDQRYNDTSKIDTVNLSLINAFSKSSCVGQNTFQVSDDLTYRYCSSVNATALGVPYSSLTGFAANCPSGQVVNGVTYPVSCVVDNTTDDTARNSIISVNNSLMSVKLNVTDQRFNETGLVNAVNTTAVNALPKSGGVMTGNITITANLGLYYNSTNYAIFNGTCWVTRASNTYSVVCP